MNTSKEFLSSLLQTAQKGQLGIRSVMGHAMQSSLRSALHSQLLEYCSIESEAHTIACQRGWELRELDPALGFLTGRIVRFRLSGANTDSRIAGRMIRSCTGGMIKNLRLLHRLSSNDHRVQILSQKLLDCERAGIHRMQGFL